MINSTDYSVDTQSDECEQAIDKEGTLSLEFDFDKKIYKPTYQALAPRTKNLKDWNDTSSKVIGKISGVILSAIFCFGVSNTENLHNIGTASIVPSMPKVKLDKAENTAKTTAKKSPVKLKKVAKKVVKKVEAAKVEEKIELSPMVETINGFIPLKELTSSKFKSTSLKAKKNGSKVLLKFGAKWCLPCRIMEENVFQDPNIQSTLNKDYETMYIDIDSFDGINLKQKFGIYSLPTYVILDQDSKLLGHYSGAKTLQEIQNILAY